LGLLEAITSESPCGQDLEDTQLLASFDAYRLFGQAAPLSAEIDWPEVRDEAARGVPHLGLLVEPEGIGAKAITAQGVTLDAVREAATAALPPSVGEVPALIPFAPPSKKALELTFREALRLGHNYIGTEHILLALLELENGEGVLSGVGVDKAAAEEYIAHVIAEIVKARKESTD